MVKYMNKLLNKLLKDFKDTPDLIIRSIKNINIIYLESISNSDKINDYILKNLNYFINKKNDIDIEKIIPSPNLKFINNYEQIKKYLTNGFAVIIYNKKILAVETRADINRSISTPDVEQSLYGPKDSFVENYQINLGLIKKRIKSNHLKIKEINIGRKSDTKVGILYIDDIADKIIVNKVIEVLNKIDIDGIFDSLELAQYFIENNSPFPTVGSTQRPDKASKSLLDGKIIISVDTSCNVLILPAFFGDFINPTIDIYNKNITNNFIKILRLICFFLTIIAPAYYIATINYNQETLPSSLLLNYSKQRALVPFPSIIEAIIMLFICEILRESDMRFPSSYGSAISILGALILGEAAVSAGIVSPIMIIVISFTFITSLIFIDLEMINAIRIFRIIFLTLASIYGLYGILLSIIILFIHLCNLKTCNKPYFYPIAPFNKTYFKKIFIKSNISKDYKRSNLISRNIIKQRTDL